MPGHFEEMTVLRIDLLGFSRTHTECRGVEAPYIVDYAGGEGIAAADLVGRGVIEGLCREAIGRDLGYAASIAMQELPKALTVLGAGEAAGIADNRYFVSTSHRKARSPTQQHVVLGPAHNIKFLLPGSTSKY
jgi:hypothetical protein